MSSPSSRCSPVAAHVAQRVGRFADEPRQRLVELVGAHPGTCPDLDTDRCQVGDGAVVGAVRVARRHLHPGAGLDERSHDADRVGQDVLTAGHGSTAVVGGCHRSTQRGGDRRRPGDPVELGSVHRSSTPVLEQAAGRSRQVSSPPTTTGRSAGRRVGRSVDGARIRGSACEQSGTRREPAHSRPAHGSMKRSTDEGSRRG